MNNYTNLDIKIYAQKHHVLEKEVAKELNIGYSTLLISWLRIPLNAKRKAQFKRAVDSIVAKRNHKNLNKQVQK